MLATHGPLVEFEGRLFTATITTAKAAAPQTEREMLHLGSAVEVKDRVWYQAGTTTPANGSGVSVEEWRIEFRDDPRTADRGTAMLRGRWRVLTDPEGESFDAEVSFQAGNTYEKGRTVTLNWPIGMPQPRRLPRLEIAGAGLSARAELDAAGTNEGGFLDPLREVVASGITPADRLLAWYNGEWKGDVSHVYEELSF